MARQRVPFTLATDSIPRITITTSNTALLVQDVQNYYVDPESGLGKVAKERGIYYEFDEYFRQLSFVTENIIILLKSIHSFGFPVIFTVCSFNNHFGASKLQKAIGMKVSATDYDAAISKMIEPSDDELIISKPGFGAFQGTNLEEYLKQNGIENLIVTGVITEFGIRNTVFVAQDLGFRPLVISDGVASLSFETQQRAIQELSFGLIKVRSMGEVIQHINFLQEDDVVLL